jgi:DNA-binding MarR family transcriptional regulator
MVFQVNQSLGFLLGTLAKKTASRFSQLMQAEKIDIGLSGWIVLSRLWEEDGLSQQEISERSGVAKPNISTYVDALEKTDYVVRVDDTADRRNYKIYMTQKAKKLKEKCQSLAQQSNDETLQPLTDAEKQTFIKLLMKLKR